MTQHTRDGTDAARASKILRGLRERVSALEKRDRHAENIAHVVRSRAESVRPVGTATVGIYEVSTAPGTVGFGATPFGTNFGDPSDSTTTEDTTTTTTESTLVRELTITNTTTEAFQAFVARAFTPGETRYALPHRVAIGSGDGAFVPSNGALHNEIDRVRFTESSLDETGRAAVFRAHLGSEQFNGHTLRELGLVNADDLLFNHAEIAPPIEKTSEIEVTIEIEMSITEDG